MLPTSLFPKGPCAQTHLLLVGKVGPPRGWMLLGAAHPPGRIQGLIFALSRGRFAFGTREEDVHVSRFNLLLEGKILSGKDI